MVNKSHKDRATWEPFQMTELHCLLNGGYYPLTNGMILQVWDLSGADSILRVFELGDTLWILAMTDPWDKRYIYLLICH